MQGALYAVTLFLGIYNSITVQPAIAVERAVFYRERSAYMYAVWPWCVAQVRPAVGQHYAWQPNITWLRLTCYELV